MINIHYGNQANGPGKVVSNLLKGLDKLGVKYKSNQTIVPEEHQLSLQVSSVLHSEHISKAIIGPNICTLPFDNNVVMQQQYKKILVPCQWVLDLYKRWLPEEKIAIWAVGIDTDTFTDFSEENKSIDCLIYLKRRSISDLSTITSILSKYKQTFEIIQYGEYTEEKLLETIKKSRYGFICDGSESQGIAIQEMMSCNLPLFVWDITTWDDRGAEHRCQASSIPYWNELCGISETNQNNLENRFEEFLKVWFTFRPREYILSELNLEKQAQALINLFNT